MNKKILIIFPIILFLGIIFYAQANRKNKKEVSPPSNHFSPTVTLTPTTTTKSQSDAEQIKQALADKNNWNPEEIKITVSKNDGLYATGGVGSITPGPGGGMWFAAKVDGNWQIVWDGNGVISCENLTNYPDYPTTLIPECYDSLTNKTVKR